MLTGLILLALIALGFAWLLAKARGRVGLGMSGKTWITAIVGFGLIVLVIYVAQQ